MAQNRSSPISIIEKFIHEQVNRDTERINCEISDVLRKDKECKCNTKREMRECWLFIEKSIPDIKTSLLHSHQLRRQG